MPKRGAKAWRSIKILQSPTEVEELREEQIQSMSLTCVIASMFLETRTERFKLQGSVLAFGTDFAAGLHLAKPKSQDLHPETYRCVM